MGWAAELLYRIASYHEGVASPASTSACHCCTPSRWQGADDALCSHTTLATCYVTQEKTQHILGSLLREQYAEQQAETPCSGMWLSLGVVEVALSAAALEGGISTINWVKPFHSPSRDESDPNHLWSGGEMGLSPPHPGHRRWWWWWWGYALGRLTKNKRSSSFKQNVGLVRCTRAEKGGFKNMSLMT